MSSISEAGCRAGVSLRRRQNIQKTTTNRLNAGMNADKKTRIAVFGGNMRKAVLSVVFACTVFVVGALAQSKQSEVGTWKLDMSQSDFGPDAAPKSVTLTILKDTPAMLSWRVRMVDEKGNSSSISWSGPQDGSLHPVMQNGKEISKQSAKRESGGSLHRHGEEPDGSSFDAYSKMSDDGNSITDELYAKDKDGKQLRQKFVYHRVMKKHA